MAARASKRWYFELSALCTMCGLFRSKRVLAQSEARELDEMAFLSELTSTHEHRDMDMWEVDWSEVRYPIKRDYVAELGWYHRGQSDDPWRNKIDGFHWAARTTQHGSSLQEVMDQVVGLRRAKDGLKYAFVEVTVTSRCAACIGNRNSQQGRTFFSTNKCPKCKGRDTKQMEVSVRL